MSYKLIFIVSLLCVINSFSLGMEKTPGHQKNRQEATNSLWRTLHECEFKVTKELIEGGIADINAQDTDNNTPLIFLAKRGYTGIVDCWMRATGYQYTYEIDKENEKSNKFDLADRIMRGQTEVVQILIKAEADLNTANKFNHTALTYAIKQDNTDFILALVHAKANVPDMHKIKILKKACIYKYNKNDYQDAIINILDPAEDPIAKNKILTLLMLYNKYSHLLTAVPKEILKMIVTYAHPEFAISHVAIQSLPPIVLVDSVPLKTLAHLIKIGILQHNVIYNAWQKKLAHISDQLKSSKHSANNLPEDELQQLTSQTLGRISILLQP